jgi:histidine ammonia-lyase
MLAAPAAAQHTSVGAGIESHASFAPAAARQTGGALDRYADALATELVLAVRALRLADRAPAGSRALWERAVAELPAGLEDRALAGDLASARMILEPQRTAPADRAV